MSTWKQMIADAKELLDMGAITQEEFEQTKREAFALRSQSTNPGSTTPPPASPSRQDTLMGDTLMGSTGGGFGKTGGDTLAGVTQFQAVGQTIGSYKVLGEIGQGGMGTVYRARHSVEAFAQQTGDVVIKLMNPQFAQDPTFRQRFITEAATGRNIQHPNVVRIHDVIFEEHKNVLAIVMDLVEGRPLENIIPSGGMPMEQALPIIEQLSEALDHIHDMGIIHRDLKPENIIVSPSGKPVILDMGIAKNTDNNANMTRTNSAMGTPLYMAPEQVDAKNVTSASDRYAFGLIVYQMLSGQLPWDRGSGLGMITAYKMMGNLNPLKDVANVSDCMSDGVMKLLCASESDRWDTCAEFLNAFVESEKGRALGLAEDRAEQFSNLGALVLIIGGQEVSLGTSRSNCNSQWIGQYFRDGAQFWSTDAQFDLLKIEREWFVVPNMGATNETMLNGRKITKTTKLYDDDIIGVGKESKGIVKTPMRVRLPNGVRPKNT